MLERRLSNSSVLFADSHTGEMASYRVRYTVVDGADKSYRYQDVGLVTVYTVQRLQLATCYSFNVAAQNKYGTSAYMRSDLRACSLSKYLCCVFHTFENE